MALGTLSCSISLNSLASKCTVPSYHPVSSPSFIQYNFNRHFPLPSVASIPYQPIDVNYLEGEFSGHGVTFEGVGDSCVAKLGLDNGSMATILLPSGLITSYKAPMWHGGQLELLHTSVSEAEDASALIQGGMSLAFNCERDASSWSPRTWVLHDIRGNALESIQVELTNREADTSAELKYSVTLQEDSLSSELIVFNSSTSYLQLRGSIVSHLTVSTPDATYAVGLEGSDYFNKPPFLSEFVITPNKDSDKKENGFSKIWNQVPLKKLFNGWGSGKEGEEESNVGNGEEADNYKHLKEEMSRIYTSAPRNFTIIDRGRRNSVSIRRDGFEELYLLSPGSSLECYGKNAYICIGQAAILKSIVVSPGEVWRGGQHLHNPNL